ncbi:chromosomal replication initiator protein DnaA [Pectobacterium parvum]|uniref:ATP-binding protein n=2 Tax=Pectobacteriaceae TaxID=1903410 RepID=A0AAP9LFR0_9GAMM|nr:MULTISPECIES: chromosomal replication initiator protein DnaA [Pectobacterium]KHS93049.1 chromosomal replication initiator protein DnaA [Pectobacterium parvum]QHQ26684.1 ATP-binding protein [Pectobacterium parvum]
MSIKKTEIRNCISKLANNIRAEKIDYSSYLELYSGDENIRNINNINNSVIYGRRGSGKTHLLKALSEDVLNDFSKDKIFPVYIDLRRIIPLIPTSSESQDVNAVLIFKYLIQEVSYSLYQNIPTILEMSEFDTKNQILFEIKLSELKELFSELYLEFDGRELKKTNDLTVSEEEVKSINGGLEVSKNPSLKLSAEGSIKESKKTEVRMHISILHITNTIEKIIESLGVRYIMILLDEWSEISKDTQPALAEIIKKTFSAISVITKIAAIPNRTNLGFKNDNKFFGLEDGGDIFGYHLDLRYVFEVNKNQTRDFFNDLLYKHLSSIDKNEIDALIKKEKKTKDSFINIMFANVSLNEILIACAGIPRDFMNLFLNSYDRFMLSSSSSALRISVKNLRSANAEWYEKDKKEQVDKNEIEKNLLTKIVQEVIEKKKSMHFLIPEKYSNNKHIQNLIDFRVIHLRKSGYSHQDHAGVSYNVYSIDYGCYNSLNITKNKLNTSVLNDINIKELREIRRISLEDSFFQAFMMDIGEAFICPHLSCKKPIDVNHPAYVKQGLCNNCFDKVI